MPARRELWQSKAFVTGAVAAGLLVLVAVLGPPLAAAAGQDYVSFHADRIDPVSGMPLGGFGGISGEHWLGVEPVNGSDVFARVVHSLRFSLGVTVCAAVVEVLLGLLVAVAVRRGNTRGLLRPTLMYGALLVPLNLIFEVGIAFQGTGLRPPALSWVGMLAAINRCGAVRMVQRSARQDREVWGSSAGAKQIGMSRARNAGMPSPAVLDHRCSTIGCQSAQQVVAVSRWWAEG